MKKILDKIKKGTIKPHEIVELPPEQKYLIIGALALKAKQYQKAIDFLEKVKHIEMAKRLLGYSFFAQGKFTEAIAWLESVKRKTSSDFMLLSLAYLIQGDEHKSKHYLKITMSIDKPKAINMLRSFILSAKQSKKTEAIKKLIAMLEQ